MNDSIPQPARWYQFTAQGMLLVVLVVAAFFAGRDVAHRESMSEVSSLLKRLQAFDPSRKPKPQFTVVNATAPVSEAPKLHPSDTFKTDQAVQLGGTEEVTTQDGGSMCYLDLDEHRLQWSHAEEGRSGYFYFGFQGIERVPEWQFAAVPERDIRELAGKPLSARFYGRGTPGGHEAIGRTDSDGAIKVTVGEVWLLRTLNDPSIIYAVKIKSQQKFEEMTVEYLVLRAKD